MTMSRQITLVFVAALSLTACRKPAPARQADAEPDVAKVQIHEIKPRTWRQTIRTFGRIEAAEKVTISAEISGKVNDVHFEEGDQIQGGQKLVTFDLAESRMQLKQAEGNLSGVAARLNEARTMLARREDLYKQRAIAKEQLEAARTNAAALEATFAQLSVGRNLARHNIKRGQLHSPVSGTVVSRNVDAGEVALPGQTLAVIHVTDTMRVTTWVTQEEINTVRTGIECQVTTTGARGRTWQAHVESVGNEANPGTGNFPVRLTVNNSDGLLKAGMSAMVTLTGLETNDAIVIPETAIVDRNRKRVVYLLDKDKAREVEPVLAAGSTGSIRQVLHGLKVGDRVIVGGIDNVADGSPVEVTGSIPLDAGMSATQTDQTQKKKQNNNDQTDAPRKEAQAEGAS